MDRHHPRQRRGPGGVYSYQAAPPSPPFGKLCCRHLEAINSHVRRVLAE